MQDEIELMLGQNVPHTAGIVQHQERFGAGDLTADKGDRHHVMVDDRDPGEVTQGVRLFRLLPEGRPQRQQVSRRNRAGRGSDRVIFRIRIEQSEQRRAAVVSLQRNARSNHSERPSMKRLPQGWRS